MSSNHRLNRPRLAKLLSTLLATTAMLSATGLGSVTQAQPYAPEGAVHEVVADDAGYGGQVALPLGGSRILRFRQPIGRVMVGNPKVGDVIPLGERTLYILGKGAGATSLTVMPRVGSSPLATLDVRVGYDVDNVRRAMRDVLPGEQPEVSARGDGLVLTGTLSSSAAVARAASLAEQYASGHVVNLMSVRGAEQVMLSVRVAEVQRTALQQLGLNNLAALWDTTGSLTLGAPALNTDSVLNLLGRDRSGDWTVQSVFDALEKKGFASTLAEPNLVALSGETAVFFAGGEFPIPVPQTGAGANTITIEYKQYGVSIGFTPTVYGDTINLAVAPEVSALDPANSIVLQGFRIPGITTRRAKTTVELRNGQSFAIAGLIRREFSDNLRGIPGASRVPIFGALMRSTGYQNNETEVVIIVTAHLAKPTDKRNLIAPTDLRQGPSEADLFMTGATDRALPAGPPRASLQVAPSAASDTFAAAPQPAAPPRPVAVSASVAPAPVRASVPAAPPAMVQAAAAPAASPAPVLAASVPAPKPAAVQAAAAARPAAPAPAIAVSLPVKPAPAPQPVAIAAPVAPKPAAPVSTIAVSLPAKPAAVPQPVAAAAPAPAPTRVPTTVATVVPTVVHVTAQPAPMAAAAPKSVTPVATAAANPPAKPLAASPPMAAAPVPLAKPIPAAAPQLSATAPKPVPVSVVTLSTPAAKPAAEPVAKPAPSATIDKSPAVQPVAMVTPSLVLPRTLAASSETPFSAYGAALPSSDDR